MEKDISLGEDDLFQVGSISKTFVAVVALCLCEKGLLDLSQEVRTIIPEFNVLGPKGEQICVSHLLSNTSGLPLGADHYPSSRYAIFSLNGFRLMSEPGLEYYDSNVGFQILGYLLERVSGRPYSELVQDLILSPLGMHDTVAAIRTEVQDKLVVGYSYMYDDRPFSPECKLVEAQWFEYTAADACIASTIKDMTTFLRMLLKADGKDEPRIFSPESYREMITPRAKRGEDSWYGYGTYNRKIGDNCIIGHGGDMPGYQSMMLGDTDLGIGVVVFCNGPGSPWRIAYNTLVHCQERLKGQEGVSVAAVYAPNDDVELKDFSGEYFRGGNSLKIRPHGDGLEATLDGDHFALRQRDDPDAFHSDNKTHDLFLWRFERSDGDVVAINHGSLRFVKEDQSLESKNDEMWASFSGHYRRFGPFDSNFRIVPRDGELYMVFPGNILYDSCELKLENVEGEHFSIPYSLEQVKFDSLENGRYLRAIYALSPYYRVD